MLAVIDNYDSFTYNLIQYLGILGVEFKIFRNDELKPTELAQLPIEGLLISPGPGRPQDAGYSLEMVQYFAGKIPILGVCLGHQIIAQAFGGVVDKAPAPMHGKISTNTHNEKDLFQGLPNPLEVTRYHSLMVTQVPACLEVTAQTTTSLVIMGLKHKTLPIYGVQFHPEAIKTQGGLELLANFVKIMPRWTHA